MSKKNKKFIAHRIRIQHLSKDIQELLLGSWETGTNKSIWDVCKPKIKLDYKSLYTIAIDPYKEENDSMGVYKDVGGEYRLIKSVDI